MSHRPLPARRVLHTASGRGAEDEVAVPAGAAAWSGNGAGAKRYKEQLAPASVSQ